MGRKKKKWVKYSTVAVAAQLRRRSWTRASSFRDVIISRVTDCVFYRLFYFMSFAPTNVIIRSTKKTPL